MDVFETLGGRTWIVLCSCYILAIHGRTEWVDCVGVGAQVFLTELLSGCKNCLHKGAYVHMSEDIDDRPPYAVKCHSNPQQGNPSVIFISGVLFA